MKKIKLFKPIISSMLVLLLAIPVSAITQVIEENVAAESSEKVFLPEELDQLLAPIALYPDALLAQVLTAATYPLEDVQANRFVKANPGLKGAALLEAAKDKDWEPSVKAMLEFPDVLAMMDEQLEWTQKLGDAFLAQQGDCMDAVQRLRQQAHEQGNLITSEKQVIRIEPQTQIIIIEPASPEVVYVPVYDPLIIYGHWWHPRYPPYHFYPRRYSGISFSFGVFVVTFWGGWGTWDCNWHNHYVYVNLNHYHNFTKSYYRSGDHFRFYQYGQDRAPWRYDSRHREVTRYQKPVSSLTVRPTTSEVRKYEPLRVSAPLTNIVENVSPRVNTVKRSKNNPASSKETPATILKEVLVERTKIKPSERVDVRTRAERPKSVEIVTRDLRVQEVVTSSAVKNNVKEEIENQVVKSPPAGNSKPKKEEAQVIVKEKLKQAIKYKSPSNKSVLSSFLDSGTLRANPKFLSRTDYGARSK